MNMSTTILPTTPSELIRAALADLHACEHDDRYVVDMGWWHEPVYNYDYETCAVCLAGAVMAQTLGLPDDLDIDDDDLEQYGRVGDRLRALDCFRRGRIKEGLDMVGYDDADKLSEEWQQYASVAKYDKSNPDKFHVHMNSLADYFESCGI